MQTKRRLAWGILITHLVAATITMILFFTHAISDRTLLGLTVYLSFEAPLLECMVALFVAEESSDDVVPSQGEAHG